MTCGAVYSKAGGKGGDQNPLKHGIRHRRGRRDGWWDERAEITRSTLCLRCKTVSTPDKGLAEFGQPLSSFKNVEDRVYLSLVGRKQ